MEPCSMLERLRAVTTLELKHGSSTQNLSGHPVHKRGRSSNSAAINPDRSTTPIFQAAWPHRSPEHQQQQLKLDSNLEKRCHPSLESALHIMAGLCKQMPPTGAGRPLAGGQAPVGSIHSSVLAPLQCMRLCTRYLQDLIQSQQHLKGRHRAIPLVTLVLAVLPNVLKVSARHPANPPQLFDMNPGPDQCQ
eukprot:6158753-Amphidinium_carterae.1